MEPLHIEQTQSKMELQLKRTARNKMIVVGSHKRAQLPGTMKPQPWIWEFQTIPARKWGESYIFDYTTKLNASDKRLAGDYRTANQREGKLNEELIRTHSGKKKEYFMKRGKKLGNKPRLIFVLNLIGQEDGASFPRDQSRGKVKQIKVMSDYFQ